MTLIKPQALQVGDEVALISPASRATSPLHIEQTKQMLEAEGFRVWMGKHQHKLYGNFAGRDEERLADFHEAWQNPNIKAVLCYRGGTGSIRLLPDMDYDLIRANPKIFAGFSDITAMHLAIHQQTGLVTFHSPVMALLKSTAFTNNQFWRTVTTREPLGALPDPPHEDIRAPFPPFRHALVEGDAEGQLIGGNLTLVAHTLSTPYEINTTGKILFLEDVDEEPSILDMLFTQLAHAGKFEQVAGIIIGQCEGVVPAGRFHSNYSIEEVVHHHFSHLRVPVVYGVRLGHSADMLTLPLGVQTRLSVRQQQTTINLEESACL